jgi:hypothetical protein
MVANRLLGQSLRIPLNHSGHLHLSVPFDSKQPPATVASLATSLWTVFSPKLEQLRESGLVALAAACDSSPVAPTAKAS